MWMWMSSKRLAERSAVADDPPIGAQAFAIYRDRLLAPDPYESWPSVIASDLGVCHRDLLRRPRRPGDATMPEPTVEDAHVAVIGRLVAAD